FLTLDGRIVLGLHSGSFLFFFLWCWHFLALGQHTSDPRIANLLLHCNQGMIRRPVVCCCTCVRGSAAERRCAFTLVKNITCCHKPAPFAFQAWLYIEVFALDKVQGHFT